jgi:hypothetical protein
VVKVHQPWLSVAPNQDIFGSDVTMDDLRIVSGLHASTNTKRQFQFALQ